VSEIRGYPHCITLCCLEDQIADETVAPRFCKSYGKRERPLNLALHCSSSTQHGARDAAARALVLCAMLPRGEKKVERTHAWWAPLL
jgi:hypothetical protein